MPAETDTATRAHPDEKAGQALHPAWGWIAAGFYATHGISLLSSGSASHLLWSCHLACVVLAVGIWWSSPTLAGTAFLWLAVGLPGWVASIVAREGFFAPTSTLTHVFGLVLAVGAVRAAGWRKGTWWKAMLGLVALWLVTRAVLPDGPNINLTRDYWFGWEGEYVTYPAYLGILALVTAAICYGLERTVRAVWP